jgi:Ser/Thr protein kinase RdoA (MazF antagonist)
MKPAACVDPSVEASVLDIVKCYLSNKNEDKQLSLGKWEDLGGSARSRVLRFIAVRAGRSWTFVLKAPVERAEQSKEWTDRAGRLGNEVAALRFLQNELGGMTEGRCVVAKMIGSNLEQGLIVLEEIAPVRGRLDGLMWGSFKVQGGVAGAVEKLAVALAQVHSASAGVEKLRKYSAERDATGCRQKSAPDPVASVAGLIGMAQQLGVEFPSVEAESQFQQQLSSCFAESFASDGAFSALIHADLCPDNCMVLNKRGDVCILDFEFCRPGNALMDVSFIRLAFPTCWCAGRLSRQIVRASEKAYRANVSISAARDRGKWRKAMAQCCALWTWGFVKSSIDKGALEADATMSKIIANSPTRRQMILFRLAVTAKALSKVEELHALHHATLSLMQTLKIKWPHVKEPDPIC